MKLFKREEEKEEEQLTLEDCELLEKLDLMKRWVLQLQSDRNLGEMSEEKYQEAIKPVEQAIKKVETYKNIEAFDVMMGRPLDFLNDIFGPSDYNEEVHDVIERIDDERSDF